jgi:hypothetical protein
VRNISTEAREELAAMQMMLGDARYIEFVWDQRRHSDPKPSSKIGWPIQRTPGVVINTWPHMGAEIPAHTLTRIERQYAAVADLDSWRAK